MVLKEAEAKRRSRTCCWGHGLRKAGNERGREKGKSCDGRNI